MRYFFLVVLMFAAFSTYASASPCDGVDRNLPSSRKEVLAPEIVKQLNETLDPEIAKELNIQYVDIIRSFRIGGWSILFIKPDRGEVLFLFYVHDPLTSYYVAMWSGVAMSSEEKAIRSWTFKNVPGIPKKLAACFAWHVTNDKAYREW